MNRLILFGFLIFLLISSALARTTSISSLNKIRKKIDKLETRRLSTSSSQFSSSATVSLTYNFTCDLSGRSYRSMLSLDKEHCSKLGDRSRVPRTESVSPLCLPRASDKEQLAPASLFRPVSTPQRFEDMEYSCYSQTTEDGVLLALLAAVGLTDTPRVVEICAGVGYESNAGNLIVHHGFKGVLFDGSAKNVQLGNNFFQAHPNTKGINEPIYVGGWVTAENVNESIERAGFKGEIDVFSLDIDGVDYWIWNALRVVQPRIVVVEIQEIWGWWECLTRPYAPDLSSNGHIPRMGASIRAFMYLADQKGYRLVGCVKAGFNAFFVRNDLAQDIFQTEHYDPRGCFWHWHTTGFWRTMQKRQEVVNHVTWYDPCRDISYDAHHDYHFPKNLEELIDLYGK